MRRIKGEEDGGVEQVLDLGFGRCSLQVQVPERGSVREPRELVGGNVVTSFVGLTEQYFRELEGVGGGMMNGNVGGKERKRLRTKIKYVGGSVEAACALGVADGIVDLVGMLYVEFLAARCQLMVVRIRRNDESSRTQSHRHCREQHSSPHQIETPI